MPCERTICISMITIQGPRNAQITVPYPSACGEVLAQYDADSASAASSRAVSGTNKQNKRKQRTKQGMPKTSNVHEADKSTTNGRCGAGAESSAEARNGASSNGASSGGGLSDASIPSLRSRPMLFTQEDFAISKEGTIGHDILSYFFCSGGEVVRPTVYVDADLVPQILQSMRAVPCGASDGADEPDQSTEPPCEEMLSSAASSTHTSTSTVINRIAHPAQCPNLLSYAPSASPRYSPHITTHFPLFPLISPFFYPQPQFPSTSPQLPLQHA